MSIRFSRAGWPGFQSLSECASYRVNPAKPRCCAP